MNIRISNIKKYKLAAFLILFVVFSISSSIVFNSSPASAAYYCSYDGREYTSLSTDGYDNRAPKNYSECKARMLCGNIGGDDSRRGAIWFSNSMSDYYSDDVVVNNGANSVPVYVRGSFFTCYWPTTPPPYPPTSHYLNAHQIRDDSDRIRLNTSLAGVVPGVLERGYAAISRWDFSGQGGSLTANLDVSDLGWGTVDCQSGYTCSNVTINLYRCPTTSSNCYADPVKVTVNRPFQWNLEPSTKIKSNVLTTKSAANIDAYPNEILTWTHYVTNNGPNMVSKNIVYYYGNNAALGGDNVAFPTIAYTPLQPWRMDGIKSSDSPTYRVNQADVGTSLCRRTIVSDTSNSNATNYPSGFVCANIPYNYLLTPTVNVTPQSVEPGSSVSITGRVENKSPNTHPDTKSQGTQWRLTKITMPQTINLVSPFYGTTNNGPYSDSRVPCSSTGGFFRNSLLNVTCSTIASSTDSNVVFNANLTTSLSSVIDNDIKEYDGNRVCYALSVQPRQSNSGAQDANWSHSAISCIDIAKKPKIQVWGGDVKVGRNYVSSNITTSNIQTSTSVKTLTSETSPRIFGSWAEYALIAPGLISGAGSGSALYQGLTKVTGVDQCDYSFLSFSNSGSNLGCDTNPKLGGYSFKKSTIPDIASKFPVSDLTDHLVAESDGNINLGNVDPGLYTSDTNINIKASTISVGKSIIINAPNITVTIKGNINYSNDNITGISSIPQVVIIARTINIEEGVTNIDSWLVAKQDPKDPQPDQGHIYTCSGYSLPFTSLDCVNKLTINGPVMANHLHLLRTAGSGIGTTSGDPAEVLNLRADAYLWAYAKASGSGRLWTVYSTNVPPRL